MPLTREPRNQNIYTDEVDQKGGYTAKVRDKEARASAKEAASASASVEADLNAYKETNDAAVAGLDDRLDQAELDIDAAEDAIDELDSRIREVDPRGAVYTAAIPTTGWTTASYGAYIDVAFQGAVFHSTDLVFVDLNTPSDGTMTAENEAWGAILEAEPQEETGNIRFKAQEVPSVAIPVKAWVAQKAAVEVNYSAEFLAVLKAVYPIGSIYMSVNAVPPSTLFGFGTWEQIEDTFLLAAGQSYTAGDTGGEAEHTLTIDEMPSHNHNLRFYQSAGSIPAGWGVVDNVNQKSNWESGMVASAGNSQPHNNMPPYLAVYVWKRVA